MIVLVAVSAHARKRKHISPYTFSCIISNSWVDLIQLLFDKIPSIAMVLYVWRQGYAKTRVQGNWQICSSNTHLPYQVRFSLFLFFSCSRIIPCMIPSQDLILTCTKNWLLCNVCAWMCIYKINIQVPESLLGDVSWVFFFPFFFL